MSHAAQRALLTVSTSAALLSATLGSAPLGAGVISPPSAAAYVPCDGQGCHLPTCKQRAASGRKASASISRRHGCPVRRRR